MRKTKFVSAALLFFGASCSGTQPAFDPLRVVSDAAPPVVDELRAVDLAKKKHDAAIKEDAAKRDAVADTAPPAPDVSKDADPFGVKKIYSSTGREWFLANALAVNDREFVPDTAGIIQATPDPSIFHTEGDGSGSASVRLHVHSPAGKAWWQNVEMTMYARITSMLSVCADSQVSHFELAARGERHWYGLSTMPYSKINDGVAPPAGTATWPWYGNSGLAANGVNWRCLGSTYHGNLYASDGRMLFEKEISHIDGYSGPKGSVTPATWTPPIGRWVGYKFIVRNTSSGSVRLEAWSDIDATNTWTLVSSYNDAVGGWLSRSSTLDGCAMAPYKYVSGGVIGWAGPWALFRSDCMGMDFKWLSVREVGPIL